MNLNFFDFVKTLFDIVYILSWMAVTLKVEECAGLSKETEKILEVGFAVISVAELFKSYIVLFISVFLVFVMLVWGMLGYLDGIFEKINSKYITPSAFFSIIVIKIITLVIGLLLSIIKLLLSLF